MFNGVVLIPLNRVFVFELNSTRRKLCTTKVLIPLNRVFVFESAEYEPAQAQEAATS